MYEYIFEKLLYLFLGSYKYLEISFSKSCSNCIYKVCTILMFVIYLRAILKIKPWLITSCFVITSTENLSFSWRSSVILE